MHFPMQPWNLKSAIRIRQARSMRILLWVELPGLGIDIPCTLYSGIRLWKELAYTGSEQRIRDEMLFE